ncbi:uncharacterized protein V6R79_018298 [Siganus canaliculatus]
MGKIYQVLVNGLRGEKMTIDLCNTEEQMQKMTVLQLKEKIIQRLPGSDVTKGISMSSSTYRSGYNYSRPVMPEVQNLHGLHNQGSTCYLNSVLQVLFRTEDFRAAVERHCHENTAGGNCLDCRLQSLFDELKWRTGRTHSITKCLGIDRVNVQRDAAEYFEKILSLTSSHVSQVFRGLLTDRTICSSCGTEMDSDGPFWHLPLALVDSDSELYSVVNGTEDYFRESRLTGENQIYCDSCDAKSDGVTKSVVKNHPEVLMLLLKRFTFDYMYMQYVKIDSTVEVPYTLHIPENQTYELYAVVDHFGSLRGGHYSATINVNGEWYTFNDISVTKTRQVNIISSSAYLLFYKKTNVHTVDNGTHNIHEVSTTGNFPTPKTGICVTDDRNDSSPEIERMTNDNNRFNDARSNEACRDVDYQRSDPQQREEWYDCINYPETEKQKDKSKVREDEEDVRGNSEAANQTEEAENLLLVLKDNEDDLSAGTDMKKVRGKSEADNQAEKRKTLLVAAEIQEPDRAQDTDCRRRDDVKQIRVSNIHWKEQRRRVMSVNRDNEGAIEGSRERTPNDMLLHARRLREQRHSSGHSEHKESNTEAHGKGKSSGNKTLLKIYDLCSPKHGTAADITDDTSIPHQRHTERPRSRFERCLEQKEEKKDVQEASDQRRGHEKRSQSKERLERQHQYEGHLSKQNNGGSDDAREEKSEQTVSATHKKHEAVDEEIKTEVRRVKSSMRRTKAAGSRRVNPGCGREEKLIQVESQREASPVLNEDSEDRRRSLKRSRGPEKKTLKRLKTSNGTPKSEKPEFIGETKKKVSKGSVLISYFRKLKLNRKHASARSTQDKVDSSRPSLSEQNDEGKKEKTPWCFPFKTSKNEEQD